MNQRDALSQVFRLVVKDYETRYPDLNLAYEPYVERIYQTVEREIDFSFEADRQLFVEEEISSSDLQLFGSPDWVRIDKHHVELIDFKLSTDARRIASQKNLSQILFYAFLVLEAYGRYPTSAKLVGLGGVEVPIQLSRSQSMHIARNAKSLLAKLTAAKRNRHTFEELASPEVAACSPCRYRDVCAKVVTTV